MRSLNEIRNSNSEFIETLKGCVHDRIIFPLSEIQISIEGRFFLLNQPNKSCKIKDNFEKRFAIHRWTLFINMYSVVHQ